jgi:hypothetical protein
MDDRDIFDMELSPGEQPPSGMGDRLVVGIAAIALLGGLAIAVLNAVPNDEAALASPTPSLAPSPTPVPIPTRPPARVVTVVPPDVEIVQPTPQPAFSGWIRALTDILVVAGPQADAARVGVLAKGTAAQADQEDQPATEPGWLHVDNPEGWIESIRDGEPLIRRYEWPSYRSSGWVESIGAGNDRAVAMVVPVSEPNSYLPAGPLVSSDGVTWRSGSASAFGSWGLGGVSWGPAGWLGVSYVSDWNDTSRIWLWRSADGQSWTRLGMMGGVTSDYPNQLVASERGYLLITNSQGYGGPSRPVGNVWFSPDGNTWTESNDPALNGPISGEVRLRAAAGGFYLWDSSTQPITGPRFAAFSADGLTWRRVADAQDGVNLQLTDAGGRLLAIDADRSTLAARVWSGTIARGQVVWSRRPEADAAFVGGVITQLVTDGARAYAFGSDLSSGRALVWTWDRGAWKRTELPASFGAAPTLAAAWPGGVVVVGHRSTLRGDNPIFWHRTPSGGWLPESAPVIAYVPDPTGDECPPLPTDFLEFVTGDAAGVLACHGAQPITFRAWSATCDQCWGYDPADVSEPGWLLQPTDNQLYLNPTKTTDGGWWTNAVLSPGVTVNPSWRTAWVEVTGHYDDPAAVTCRHQPSADELQWGWSGIQGVITQCRQTFVVTTVKVVGGP